CHNNMEQFEPLNLKTFLSKKRITNFYEKMLLTRQYIKCNNHFIAISSHTQNFFKRNLPETLRNNIHLLHNAIEFDQFCLNSIKQHGLDLVNIGTFNENKNQRFLIDVLVELHNRGYSRASITFCGSGSTFSDVVSYAEKKGVLHAANFLGIVANLKDVLSEKNIYVHAAKSEALGLTLLEAMAAGLPVVTLDGGGNRDLIEQGKNGWMIYKEDVEQFADAILKIANNENLYHQMSSYAVEFARQFDMNIYVQKLVQLYKDA
ncbi:MAG: glycosyltransferase family 4 protein, partial [Chitinophagales bacterium]|nr:glycosyltransferase family 4 protein [Chitinophagales bacterium]